MQWFLCIDSFQAFFQVGVSIKLPFWKLMRSHKILWSLECSTFEFLQVALLTPGRRRSHSDSYRLWQHADLCLLHILPVVSSYLHDEDASFKRDRCQPLRNAPDVPCWSRWSEDLLSFPPTPNTSHDFTSFGFFRSWFSIWAVLHSSTY